eukprot:tig00000821_g4495.t1
MGGSCGRSGAIEAEDVLVGSAKKYSSRRRRSSLAHLAAAHGDGSTFAAEARKAVEILEKDPTGEHGLAADLVLDGIHEYIALSLLALRDKVDPKAAADGLRALHLIWTAGAAREAPPQSKPLKGGGGAGAEEGQATSRPVTARGPAPVSRPVTSRLLSAGAAGAAGEAGGAGGAVRDLFERRPELLPCVCALLPRGPPPSRRRPPPRRRLRLQARVRGIYGALGGAGARLLFAMGREIVTSRIEDTERAYALLASLTRSGTVRGAMVEDGLHVLVLEDLNNPMRQNRYRLSPARLLLRLALHAPNHGALEAAGGVRAAALLARHPEAELAAIGLRACAAFMQTQRYRRLLAPEMAAVARGALVEGRAPPPSSRRLRCLRLGGAGAEGRAGNGEEAAARLAAEPVRLMQLTQAAGGALPGPAPSAANEDDEALFAGGSYRWSSPDDAAYLLATLTSFEAGLRLLLKNVAACAVVAAAARSELAPLRARAAAALNCLHSDRPARFHETGIDPETGAPAGDSVQEIAGATEAASGSEGETDGPRHSLQGASPGRRPSVLAPFEPLSGSARRLSAALGAEAAGGRRLSAALSEAVGARARELSLALEAVGREAAPGDAADGAGGMGGLSRRAGASPSFRERAGAWRGRPRAARAGAAAPPASPSPTPSPSPASLPPPPTPSAPSPLAPSPASLVSELRGQGAYTTEGEGATEGEGPPGTARSQASGSMRAGALPKRASARFTSTSFRRIPPAPAPGLSDYYTTEGESDAGELGGPPRPRTPQRRVPLGERQASSLGRTSSASRASARHLTPPSAASRPGNASFRRRVASPLDPGRGRRRRGPRRLPGPRLSFSLRRPSGASSAGPPSDVEVPPGAWGARRSPALPGAAASGTEDEGAETEMEGPGGVPRVPRSKSERRAAGTHPRVGALGGAPRSNSERRPSGGVSFLDPRPGLLPGGPGRTESRRGSGQSVRDRPGSALAPHEVSPSRPGPLLAVRPLFTPPRTPPPLLRPTPAAQGPRMRPRRGPGRRALRSASRRAEAHGRGSPQRRGRGRRRISRPCTATSRGVGRPPAPAAPAPDPAPLPPPPPPPPLPALPSLPGLLAAAHAGAGPRLFGLPHSVSLPAAPTHAPTMHPLPFAPAIPHIPPHIAPPLLPAPFGLRPA